jgi:hypothetical protein
MAYIGMEIGLAIVAAVAVALWTNGIVFLAHG